MTDEAKYGEPWTGGHLCDRPACPAGEQHVKDRHGKYPRFPDPEIQRRVIACVNAMAGIADPAAFVATLRLAYESGFEAAREEAARVATEGAAHWKLYPHDPLNDDTSRGADRASARATEATRIASAIATLSPRLDGEKP